MYCYPEIFWQKNFKLLVLPYILYHNNYSKYFQSRGPW